MIQCLLTSPLTTTDETPIVLVTPPFGRTIADLAISALYLVKNGFQVCRFDYTYHIGDSSGPITDFTLSSALEDITAVVQYLKTQFPSAPLGVVAGSLGARASLRALCTDPDIKALISLVGIVDLQHALAVITGRDLFADLLAGRPLPPSLDVLGHQIGRAFVQDAVELDVFSLESTVRDVERCPFPFVHIAAEEDAWARSIDLERLFGLSPDTPMRQVFVLPGTTHNLENNPTAVRQALSKTVQLLNQILMGSVISEEAVLRPRFPEIVEVVRAERELLSRSYQGGEGSLRPITKALAASAVRLR